jgi:hypothetical protein
MQGCQSRMREEERCSDGRCKRDWDGPARPWTNRTGGAAMDGLGNAWVDASMGKGRGWVRTVVGDEAWIWETWTRLRGRRDGGNETGRRNEKGGVTCELLQHNDTGEPRQVRSACVESTLGSIGFSLRVFFS